jgi:hypothetical protein
MIKITFKQLVESYPNLKKVAELNYLPETRYRMAKALMHVEQEKAHYDAQYKALAEKYDAQWVTATTFSIKKERLADFNNEVEQLRAIEISLPIERLKQSNVQDQIESPADIVALLWLVHFPDLDSEAEKPFEPEATADSVAPIN